MSHTIELSDEEVGMLIGGLLCRVHSGYTTGKIMQRYCTSLKTSSG